MVNQTPFKYNQTTFTEMSHVCVEVVKNTRSVAESRRNCYTALSLYYNQTCCLAIFTQRWIW